MSSRILIALLVPTLAAPPASMAQDPAIRLSVTGNQRNSEGGLQLLPGDPVRVQVQTRDQGYLLVLNVEPGGEVRVIFPVDPFDDASIRGGRQYEIRDAAARESFIASETGAGLVYAAVSPDPFRFDSVVRDGRWNVEALVVSRDADPEDGATNLVLAMTSDRGFDFDVLPYLVQNEVTEVVEVVEENHYYADPYSYPVYCGWRSYRYYPSCGGYYDPYCYSCGRTGLFIGFGFGSPYYYSPYGYGYGYGFGHGFPRSRFFGGHFTHTSRPFTQLTGRARGYGARQFGGDRFGDGRRGFADGRRGFDDGRRGFDDGRRGFDDGRSGFDGRSRAGGGRTVAARPAVENRPVTSGPMERVTRRARPSAAEGQRVTSGPMERVARRARPSTAERADGRSGRNGNNGTEVGRREQTRVTPDAAERGGRDRVRARPSTENRSPAVAPATRSRARSTTIEGAAVTRPERATTARNVAFTQSQTRQDPPARARARPSRPERVKAPTLVRRKDRPATRSDPKKARPTTDRARPATERQRPAARPSSSDRRPTATRARPSRSDRPTVNRSRPSSSNRPAVNRSRPPRSTKAAPSRPSRPAAKGGKPSGGGKASKGSGSGGRSRSRRP